MSNAIVLAAVQTVQSHLLGVVSAGLAADLAVSPIVVASEPGIGTLNTLRSLAKGLDMEIADIRCTALNGMDFLPILKDGEIVERKPRIGLLDDILAKDRAAMVVLDDPAPHGTGEYATRIAAHVAETATGPVLLVLTCSIHDLDATVALASKVTGIHRASVPTAILRMDRHAAITALTMRGIPAEAAESMIPARGDDVREPVLLLGRIEHSGSKCGLRFIEMTVAQPYEHRVQFTVVGRADQDDDDINEAIDPMFADGDVAVRATPNEHGELECSTDDMEFVG